ncbi:MAG: hypothetical protein RDV48_18905 [Candidatus Eremiobacteraeota bacterium]|nr:hypothetical protein [Candidatus Eremiobacteraeota bacterium]
MSDEIEPVESCDEAESSDSSYDNSYTSSPSSASQAQSASAADEAGDKTSDADEVNEAGAAPASQDSISLSKEVSRRDSVDAPAESGESKESSFRNAWSSWVLGDSSGEKKDAAAADESKAEGTEGQAEDPSRSGEAEKAGNDDGTGKKAGETEKDGKSGEANDADKAEKAQEAEQKKLEDNYKDQVIGLMREMVGLLQTMVQAMGGGSASSPDSVKAGGAVDSSSKWGDLFNSWGQGAEGNCAAVSTIKAAMDKYGGNVFDKVEGSAADGYNLTMKDGTNLKLSPEELQTADRMSNFKGEGEAKDYATMCYAAMAKRALNEGDEGSKSYERALHSINNGDDPYHSAHLLGLEDNVRTLSESELSQADGAVAWSDTHAVYVDRGLTDGYGSANYYNGTDTNGKRLYGGFVFG